MSKIGLLIPLLIMMGIWIWVLSLYGQDEPELLMPIFLMGMAFMIPSSVFVGIMEYWLYEKESTHIKPGHLSIMPFAFGEWKAVVKVQYQSLDGNSLIELWEIGRVGKTNWMWTKGGGKKGYYACRILPRIYLDDTGDTPFIIEEEAELAGYWEGSLYRIPMDFSLTYIDTLKEEVARKLRSDVRFREDSPIYVAELPLPTKYRKMEALSDMMTKLHDRNEHIVELRDEINELYEDRVIRRSAQPDLKSEVHHYHTGGAEK